MNVTQVHQQNIKNKITKKIFNIFYLIMIYGQNKMVLRLIHFPN